MKVLLISDVHANLPALNAVLGRRAEEGVAEVWHAGDAVGWGPHPEEVVRRLRAEEAVGVAGNLDLKVLKVPRKIDQWRASKDPSVLHALEWTYERLSPGSRKWLAGLPRERRFRVAKRRVLLLHASPGSLKEPFADETPDSRLRDWARLAKADVVVCGHAHVPSVREVDGVLFVNAGSVGRPADGDPRACCTVLHFTPEGVTARPIRVAYDLAPVLAALREEGLPDGPIGDATVAAPAPLIDPGASAALALAGACGHDEAHTLQVTRLALALFDALRPLHGLGAQERAWLEWGALLHDIGWCEGPRGHHKTAQRIVLESPLLPYGERERAIVAAIARYHRGAPPDAKHEAFAALDAGAQTAVRVAAAVLRVADALDYTHRGLVKRVSCRVGETSISLRCRVAEPIAEEANRAVVKGDLWREVFAREVEVSWDRH